MNNKNHKVALIMSIVATILSIIALGIGLSVNNDIIDLYVYLSKFEHSVPAVKSSDETYNKLPVLDEQFNFDATSDERSGLDEQFDLDSTDAPSDKQSGLDEQFNFDEIDSLINKLLDEQSGLDQ